MTADSMIRELHRLRHQFLDKHFSGEGGTRGEFTAWGHVLAAIDELQMEEYDVNHGQPAERLSAEAFDQDLARAAVVEPTVRR